MGCVLVHLILLRLHRIYTRRVGFCAANLNHPLGVSSVFSLSVAFLLFFRVSAEPSVGPACRLCLLFSSVSASRLPLTFLFGSAFVFSSSLGRSVWFGRASLSLSLFCVVFG